MRNRSLRIVAASGLMGLVVSAFHAPSAYAADRKKIVGGGSSFSFLLIDQWRADTSNKPYALDFNYQASGSGQGRLNFAQKQLDFAASDIPYQPDDQIKPAAGSYRYITAVAGALSFMFNVVDDSGNQLQNLKLDSKQICRIFTEQLVTKKDLMWNDPGVAALNPGVALPNKKIVPVVRSDSSGTSFVLSEYCIATQKVMWDKLRTAAETDTGLGSQALADGRPISTWPSGYQSAPLSNGIANTVSSTAGSITYIEAGYQEITQLPLATVYNAAGKLVAPTPSAITAALRAASVRADGTFQLDFKTTDPTAYLPSTYSYFIVPSAMDPGKGRTMAEYVYYAMTIGQDSAEPLSFARLSQNLIDDAINTASQLPGATPFAEWKTAVGLTSSGGASGGSTGGASGGATGGSTGGASGGATGGASGGATGGSTGGSAGGSTGGASGGSTGGASGGASGGSTGGSSGGSTGGSTAGSPDPAVDPTVDAGSEVLPAGVENGNPGAPGSASDPKVVAGNNGGKTVTTAKRTTTGGAAAPAGAPVVSRKPPGRSNSDYAFVAAQGAALLGIGWALAKSRGSTA
jgi:phosphate transport system substrate-binding protein